MRKQIILLFTVLLTSSVFLECLSAQSSLAERLGYAATDKLLIIHADDLGVTHSKNQASFKAIAEGSVNSASIMAPTPWLSEVAQYVQEQGSHDFGMHLTLTSEWKWLRWGPVASLHEVRSLVDENGFFHSSCAALAAVGKPEEVAIELKAQIDQAIRMGIQPTHLDSHMGCIFFGQPGYFEAYMQLSRAYKIPAMVGREEVAALPSLAAYLQPEDILVDRIITAGESDYSGGLRAFYEKTLRSLQAGVNVLLIHCAYDDRESRGMAAGSVGWGADWRQQDTDYFLSQACQQLLQEQGIQLVTWKQIQALMR